MSDIETAQSVAALGWWRKLTGFGDNGRADTGARARMRRSLPDTALAEETTIDLLRMLRKARETAGGQVNDGRDSTLAVRLALVLSHVRTDSPRRFGRVIGRTSYTEPNSAVLKPIRFRRLLEAETEDEIITAFRRALQMTGAEMNVADLARHLISFGADRQKRRLILDYYDARDDGAVETAQA